MRGAEEGPWLRRCWASGKLAGFSSEPLIHVHVEPVNVPLLGTGVFADVIKLDEAAAD